MKTIPKKTIWYPILFILLIGLIAFLSFYKLDVKYVDPWDEARHGVNAYEMANGGSLIQSTYMRQADYYNLKPPLSMYGIMLGMAIFGNTVFALRFYAALMYCWRSVSGFLQSVTESWNHYWQWHFLLSIQRLFRRI